MAGNGCGPLTSEVVHGDEDKVAVEGLAVSDDMDEVPDCVAAVGPSERCLFVAIVGSAAAFGAALVVARVVSEVDSEVCVRAGG